MKYGVWEILSAMVLTPASVSRYCVGWKTSVSRVTTIGQQSVSSVSPNLTLTLLTLAAGQRSS